MNRRTLVFALPMLLMPLCAAAQTESLIPPKIDITEITESPIPPTATVAEIMENKIMLAANVLWGATAVYITEQGEDDRSPKNDEEWLQVDKARIVLEEAIKALLVPGRHVDVAGAVSEYPEEELNPDQIEAMIRNEPEVWAAMLHALDDTVQQAKKAIEEHDVPALTEIGGAIDDACESCHLHFWYPEH